MEHIRDVFDMIKRLEGFSSYDEIAVFMDVPVGRIKYLATASKKGFEGKEIDFLVEKYRLNPVYLITGGGDHYLNGLGGHSERQGIAWSLAPDTIPIHYRQNINSAGGYGALNDDESAELIMVPAAMLVAMFGLKNFENLDIIHVTGDSMKPIVEDGDTIMIRRTSEVNPHKVAVVRVGDKLLIKYIDYHPSWKWVKLYSEDRAAYRDMDFEGDEVNEIEVIGVLVGKFKPY